MQTRARWLAALALLVAVQATIVVIVGRGLAETGGTAWALLVLGAAASVGFSAYVVVLARRTMSNALRGLVASAQGQRGGLSAALRLGDDTEIAGIAGSFNRKAEELDLALRSLATERNRFEAVLETMAPAVIALDAERRITTANRAARTLFGLPDPVDGARLLELVRIPALHELLDRTASSATESAELELPGSRRQVQARASGLGDGGAVLVADDVSEIRRLERIRRDFVANVSHELRTPISVIRANAETLLEGVLDSPEQARPFVEALYRHSDRITRLINELLDISRMEAGKHVLAPEPLELVELAEDVIAGHENDALAKHLELSSTILPGLWALVDGKAAEQVLVNFVDNAIKYTPAGGHVEIAAELRGELVRIEVRDDGPGIDPQHRARIFERFYRVDTGRSREMGGTGLGLSIVKHLVEAMGGQLGVDARSPHGSVFWFTAPHTPALPDD
ncbi:MAG: PAS domain-containing protein [Deltaproteobacteria bacterium]|nr:PAS domain-containing protein [Nannocystaceae bacterium]